MMAYMVNEADVPEDHEISVTLPKDSIIWKGIYDGAVLIDGLCRRK